KDKQGMTTLMAATLRGNAKCVSHLLQRGVDPRASTHVGQTAVHAAAAYKDFVNDPPVDRKNRRNAVEVMRLLAQAGAEVDSADDQGMAPVHPAVQDGYLETTQFLLDHGADLNRSVTKGETPLFLAVVADSDAFAKMKLLLSRGADVNGSGPNGITPLMLAA